MNEGELTTRWSCIREHCVRVQQLDSGEEGLGARHRLTVEDYYTSLMDGENRPYHSLQTVCQ
jgi:hypothetical protein